MKHPRNEEWMEFLYGESSPEEAARLAGHLKQCGQCRAEVQRWERTRQTLDLGKVEMPKVRARAVAPWLKWGMAAGFMLAIGFAVGREISPGAAQARELRASLKAELSVEMAQQLASYKKAADEKAAQDNKVILEAIEKVNVDRVTDYAQLHKDLETVAVLTQNTFQQTQQQIVTLANYSRPENKTE
ncbi:MAG TPA: zf-HC2 domain-containing protein [Verrucomicrobiae bacterium]|jgi:anti-sigma factor RsiW|nr:zf-HC2 domain-containing protein [Verrucomicrobiae bacterium]